MVVSISVKEDKNQCVACTGIHHQNVRHVCLVDIFPTSERVFNALRSEPATNIQLFDLL